jgi:hypothetical protein
MCICLKEVNAMATSSIFDSIDVKDRESAKRLLDALEDAVRAKPEKVKMSAPVVELDRDGIKKLFNR